MKSGKCYQHFILFINDDIVYRNSGFNECFNVVSKHADFLRQALHVSAGPLEPVPDNVG